MDRRTFFQSLLAIPFAVASKRQASKLPPVVEKLPLGIQVRNTGDTANLQPAVYRTEENEIRWSNDGISFYGIGLERPRHHRCRCVLDDAIRTLKASGVLAT